MALKNVIMNDEKITCIGTTAGGVVEAVANRNLCVTGTSAVGDDYVTVEMSDAANEVIFGELEAVNVSVPDHTSLGTDRTFCTVKVRGMLKVRISAAYAATNFGSRIVGTTTEGVATFSTSAGLGYTIGGETVGTEHFAFVIY